MKKTLAILACLLLVSVLAISAFAAFDNSKVTTTPSKVDLKRGETFTVSAKLENTEQIKVGTVKLEFAEAVATMTGGKCKVVLADEFVEVVPGSDKASMVCTFAINDPTYTEAISGELFVFQFKVNDDAPYGEVTVNAKASLGLQDASYIDAEGFTINIVCDGVNHEFTEKVVKPEYLDAGATCQKKATYFMSCTCGAKGTTTFETGELGQHVYDQQKAEATFQKNPATCQKQAEYYKSCVCGEKSSETFFAGELAQHTYGQKKAEAAFEKAPATCQKQAEYYESCVCGAKDTSKTFFAGELAEHAYGQQKAEEAFKKAPATCTTQAEYYESCVCGEKDLTKTFFSGDKLPHTFDQQKTEEQYIKKAAKCGQPAEYYYSCICGEKGTEFFTFGTPGAHIYVEQDTDIQYQKSPASCTAKAVYYYSCECGANAKDEDPTRTFEFGEKELHAFTKQDTADTYLKDAATCTSKAVYYYSCNVCGEKGTTTFENGEKLPHTNVEKVADAYLKSGATCQSEAVYYKSCDVCGAKNENETFLSGTKAEHSFVTWTKVDETTHKSICEFDGCDEPKVENHVFDLTLTVGPDTHWNACICGEKVNETAHVYDKTEWKKDADAHWHECECSAKADEAKHEWDEGKVTKEPDTKEEGEKTYTCKACAQPKVEKLDKLATPKTDDNSMIVPFAVLLVLSACGVAAVLTLKKRSAI